jgi:hypothetical protein
VLGFVSGAEGGTNLSSSAPIPLSRPALSAALSPQSENPDGVDQVDLYAAQDVAVLLTHRQQRKMTVSSADVPSTAQYTAILLRASPRCNRCGV